VAADFVTLTIEGLEPTLHVVAVDGREAIGAPTRYSVRCEIVDATGAPVDIDPRAQLTAKAELCWSLPDDALRTVHLMVEGVEAVGRGWLFRLASPLATLEEAVEQRVFVDEHAIAIATAVLAEHGLGVDDRTVRVPPKRPQCVQAFEGDLAFVLRILAEEGVALRVRDDDDTTVVLADAPRGYDDIEGADALRVVHDSGMVAGELVRRPVLRRARAVEKVTLRDLDFRKPMADLTQAHGDGALERFQFPGGYNEAGIGGELAGIRLEEARADAWTLSAETTSPRLFAGGVITLVDATRDDANTRWLLLEVRHALRDRNAAGAEASRYQNHIRAVPADAAYRPPRLAAPSLGGAQTVTTTGPAGGEIHTEEHGRTKAHLRWDRRRPFDDTSSKWMRVLQPALSGGFLQPRVGWEQLVSFYGASGDSPLLIGRLYNGEAPPAEGLPGKKVVSAFGTQTTPGGGSANLLRMDDTAGNEGFALVASKDMNEKTENDKKSTVTADDSLTVGANHTLIVGQVHQVGITGAQTYSVSASRTVNVDANKGIKAASETVTIGGARIFSIGGDQGLTCSSLTRVVGGAKVETAIEHQKRHVTGVSTILIGGSWKARGGMHATTSVAGAHTEVVGGKKSVKTPKYSVKVRGALTETLASRKVDVSGDRGENFGAAALYDISGAMSIKGADVTINASSKITLKAGGATITITPGAVKIDGDYKSSTGAEENGQVEYP
jgi:type VI secretion system secreted protein VgrG